MTDLSPIVLSTYSRLTHLKETVSALQANELASKSHLFVLSDGPRFGDEDVVGAVRKYLKTITGFAEVTIIERENNGRVANNRGGMKQILASHGRLIFLEDDVVAAPGFLTYMNEALKKYEQDDRVFNVSAYTPPIAIPASYKYDGYFIRRFNAWGFGIWEDRFNMIDYVSSEVLNDFLKSTSSVSDFIGQGGADMIEMLKLDVAGTIDALDVKAMYAQFLNDMYTLYPTISMARNIGLDGSGIHSRRTKRFDVSLSDKSCHSDLPDSVFVDDQIRKSFVSFRKVTLKQKVLQLLRRMNVNFKSSNYAR